MAFQQIIVDYSNHLAHIRLNNTDSLNALTSVMVSELHDVLTVLKSREDIKIIMLSGDGRAFSAGVDLKETKADNFGSDEGIIIKGSKIFDLMASLPQVTIARVHGYCFTGALEFALMFDMMFCDDHTQFGDTHAKWAIMPRWGMTQNLARRVGLAKAKELTFRAYRVKGQEAERIGLANRSFEVGTLENEVQKIIDDISKNSFEAIGRIKQIYDQGYNTTLAQGYKIELEANPKLKDTERILAEFELRKNQ